VKPLLAGCFRDSEPNIRRALQSVAGHVCGVSVSCDPGYPADAVVVQQLAREFDLPAHVYFTARPPISDAAEFCRRGGGGYMRTVVMQEGEKFARSLGAEYLLNLDSDDWLEFEPGFTWPHGARGAACYWLAEHCNGETYPFKRVFRVGLDWRWHGPLHEEPLCDSVGVAQLCPRLPRMRYVKPVPPDRPKEHYEPHVAVCREWLRLHPDEHKYQYYLARSLTDAGRPAEAVAEYARYLAGAGDDSFRYVAARNACGHMAASGSISPVEMVDALSVWIKVDPYRAESWRALGDMATKVADSLPMNEGAVHLQREAYRKAG